MRILRSQIGSRLLVALLMTSMLAALSAPLAGSAHHAVVASYAGWVRGQLEGYDRAAVEQALEAAITANPPSFDEFLSTFVAAFQAQPLSPNDPLAALTGEALLRHLEQQLMNQVGAAVLPRLLVMKAAAQQAPPLERTASASVLAARGKRASQGIRAALPSIAATPAYAPSDGRLTAAQPLGP